MRAGSGGLARGKAERGADRVPRIGDKAVEGRYLCASKGGRHAWMEGAARGDASHRDAATEQRHRPKQPRPEFAEGPMCSGLDYLDFGKGPGELHTFQCAS